MKKYLLKEIGEIVTGNTPSKKKEEYYNSNDIPFIKPNDLAVNEILSINDSGEYISFSGMSASRIIPMGSVLVTCIGIIGKVGILHTDQAAFNQQINAIIPNNEIVNSKYLAYKLLYKRKELEHMANAPVVPIINKTQFSNLEISLPKIEIQERIVGILDKVQSLINSRKAQISALAELTISLFFEMFGDPVKNERRWLESNIGDISKSIKYGTNNKSEDKWSIDCIPVLRIPNIEPSRIVQTGLKYAQFNDKEKKDLLLEKGDLLFVRSNGNPDYIGRCAMFNLDGDYVYASYLIRVRLETELITPEFLQFQLSFPTFRRKLAEESRTTAGNYNINTQSLKGIKIICPAKELQEEYTAMVQKIKIEEKRLEKSLVEMENLFSSLKQQLFKGMLFHS